MPKLFLLFLLIFFSCSENQFFIDKDTLSKYNIVSEFDDIADTLNVYFDKTLKTKLNVSNFK